jgi:cysteine synthase A
MKKPAPKQAARSYLVDLDQMELPTIVQLGENLFAAVFVLMKLILARKLIRLAMKEGLLRSGGLVVETTSGTMGLALAHACKESGHQLSLVSDPIIDEGLQIKLASLDAQLLIVTEPLPEGGFQGARNEKLRELLRENPGSYWTEQYDNPAAPGTYFPAARKISLRVGKVDYLVASVGTGSSATGLATWLHNKGHAAKLIAVDTHHSVLFGQLDGKRHLRGLGNSITPRNLHYDLIEQVHWVTAGEAFLMTRKLFTDHLIDAGPTSGATFMVARWLAQQNPGKRVVFVCADTGERYRLNENNPKWLASNNLLLDRAPRRPKLVLHPRTAPEQWSFMNWAGRSVSDFLPRSN